MGLDEARKRFPPIWVIYDHPRDDPEHFVVRRWYGLVKEETAAAFSTLPEAREHIALEGGSVRLSRAEEDDPVILETWLRSYAARFRVISCSGK